MSENNRNKSQLFKKELNALSDIIASKFGKSFAVNTNSNEVIPLLKFAIQTNDIVVNSYLHSINQYLSQPHRKLFEQNGVDFSAFTKGNKSKESIQSQPDIDSARSNKQREMTYRGQTIVKDEPSKQEESKESNKRKRKIIYRGQEKWI